MCTHESDPLRLQMNYAELLGKCVYCNIKEKSVYDQNHKVMSLNGETLFLRCSYEKYKDAAQIILDKSGKLKEAPEDIEKIERWFDYIKPKRAMAIADVDSLYSECVISALELLFGGQDKLFLKSAQKGFSVVFPREFIRDKNAQFHSFLKSKCSECRCEQLLISEYCDVKKDANGKKEVRFIVCNGEILNCSRNLHSLKHRVSKSIKEGAEAIIKKLSEAKNFPDSYVLDVFEFVKEGKTFIDVLELNPLSVSMCYINNSVFDVCAEEIRCIYPRLGMGYEYCYDFLNNKSRYVLERYVGESYEYTSDEHWEFE